MRPALDAAITFSSTLFRTEPAKVRPGYVDFAVARLPLKPVQGLGHRTRR